MIRYVGKANNPKKRLFDHLRGKEKGYRPNWISGLKKAGLRPVMNIVEEVEFKHWQEAEIFWIAYFRQIGFSLMNLDIGGTGAHNVTDSMREKCRLIHLGKKRSVEARERMRIAHLGKKPTPEAKENHRRAMIGKKKGCPMHPNARAALRIANIGRKQSAETIAKRVAKIKGMKRKYPASEMVLKHMREMREKYATMKKGKNG